MPEKRLRRTPLFRLPSPSGRRRLAAALLGATALTAISTQRSNAIGFFTVGTRPANVIALPGGAPVLEPN